MRINLLHNHYNEQHLDQVKDEMKKRGEPIIRAIWSEIHGEWMAVEGSHRIRAAHELGMGVNIEDISNQENAIIQIDGENVNVSVADLSQELQDEAWKKQGFSF